jgi:site-specific DNA recombinase
MRWNDKASWVRSREQTYEPLITQEQWDTVEAIFVGRQRAPLARTPLAGRRYGLAGLVRRGACGRRMEGNWNNDKAHYRCQIRREDIHEQPSTAREVGKWIARTASRTRH